MRPASRGRNLRLADCACPSAWMRCGLTLESFALGAGSLCGDEECALRFTPPNGLPRLEVSHREQAAELLGANRADCLPVAPVIPLGRWL
jgi:hypothetical protein